MNPDLLRKSARWILTMVGGALTGWAVSRGYQWGEIINQMLSSEAVVGAVILVLSAIWTYASSRIPAIVHIVNLLAKDNTTPIQGVIMTNTSEGRQIANTTDGPVVTAGTTEAAKVAGTS